MTFLKLLGALVMSGTSIAILAADYPNIRGFEKVGLFGTIVASLAILLDQFRNYRKGRLFRAEIEENAIRITDWLVDNSAEFEKNGVSERSLARGANISTERATRALDQLENREAVVRDLVALTDPPRTLIKPGRNWVPTRDKLVGSVVGRYSPR